MELDESVFNLILLKFFRLSLLISSFSLVLIKEDDKDDWKLFDFIDNKDFNLLLLIVFRGLFFGL